MLKKLFGFFDKNGTKVLTVIEIGGTIYAVYRAYKDGPKFRKVLDELRETDAGFVESVKKLAPIAGPTVAAAGLSIGAAVFNEKVTGDKVAKLENGITAITSMYTMHRNISSSIEQSAREEFGDEAVDKIKKKVYGEKVVSDMSSNASETRVIVTGHGSDMFYDDYSGRYFLSDINFIKKVINDMNYQLMNDMFISLNELYANLGLPTNGMGRDFGWNCDYGQIDINIYAEFDELDRPYTVIKFKSEPVFKYSDRGRW